MIIVVGTLNSVRPQTSNRVGNVFPISKYSSSLTTADMLYWVKTQASRIRKLTRSTLDEGTICFAIGPRGVRSIFHHFNAILLSNFINLIQVSRSTGK